MHKIDEATCCPEIRGVVGERKPLFKSCMVGQHLKGKRES